MIWRLNHALQQLMLSRVAIFSDQFYGIEASKEQGVYRYSKQAPATVDCLIVGREHYSEESRSYPIQSLRELYKILALERQNSTNIYQYMVGPYVDGSRMVTSWQVDSGAVTGLGIKPWLLIPESALLVDDQTEQLLSIERQSRTFWFTKRQRQLISAEKKGLIRNEAMFLASAGLNEQIEMVSLTEQDHLARILPAVLPLVVKHFIGFKTNLRTVKSIDWAKHFKFSGLGVVATITAYMALTSGYLNIRHDMALAQSEAYRLQTKDVFSVNAKVKQLKQQTEQLATVVNQVNSSNLIWRVIAPLVNKGVEVKKIMMMPDGTFVINLEADRATDVLAMFSQDAAVVDAKFRGQSSTVKAKERFAISFKINAEVKSDVS